MIQNPLGGYVNVPCQYKVELETNNDWTNIHIIDVETHADFRVRRRDPALRIFDEDGGYDKHVSSYEDSNEETVYRKTMYIKDLKIYTLSFTRLREEIIKFNRNKQLKTLIG